LLFPDFLLLKHYTNFSNKPKTEALTGSFKIKKLPNGLKNDQRILFSNPLVAFASVGNVKLLEFFSNFGSAIA